MAGIVWRIVLTCLRFFVEFIDFRVQHVGFRAVRDSTFMVTTVSGMVKLSTAN